MSADYRKLNPTALVPTLIDGDAVIGQSLAIIEYLEETHPQTPLLPADAIGRARVRDLALGIACDTHPLNNLRVLKYLKHTLGVDEDAKNAWYRHWVHQGLQAFEAQLTASSATGRYCHGDAPTIADICLVPQVANARRLECDLSAMPTVVRIDAACRELPASMPPRRASSPTRSKRADQPIRTGTKILSSPRCTSSATVLPALASSALTCPMSRTGTPFSDNSTSPGCMPALAAGPADCSMSRPSAPDWRCSCGLSGRNARPSCPRWTSRCRTTRSPCPSARRPAWRSVPGRAIAPDIQLELVAGRGQRDHRRQVAGRHDGLAVDLPHHIARLQAGAFGGAALSTLATSAPVGVSSLNELARS